MKSEHGTNRMDDSQVAWACARLLAMARTAATRSAQLDARLHAFDAAAALAAGGAALAAAELDRIVTDVFALQDGADVMGSVANRLRGRDESVVVARDELRAEAVRAFAAGSADRSFVLFAAGMLTTGEGFPALADALTANVSLMSEWGDLSVRDLLSAFHASDPTRARRVSSTALIHPDAPLASLDSDMIQRLAEALRRADA
ncbi:MAG TPA: hypothetical protein VFF79_15585 [Conexibacter sp.]|jgi:hypothetical protein|nr:hypothetical protein [Conexibacter sp.]